MVDPVIIVIVAFGLVAALAVGQTWSHYRALKKQQALGTGLVCCPGRKGRHAGGCPCALTGKGEPPSDCAFCRGSDA